MSKILFLEYPKCSTCQKARKWLEENGVVFEARHIVDNNPNYDELSAWYKKSQLPLKRLFNTSGLVYRSLELKDKLALLGEDEQLELLATNGMLVKRPLVIGTDFVLAGFNEKLWQEVFLEG